MTTQDAMVRYHIVGMDCADDAREIAEAALGVATVADVRVSVASQFMTLHLANAPDGASDVEQAVAALGYQLDRLDEESDAGQATHLTTAYRRALWLVVLLNVGYGAVEMVSSRSWGSSQSPEVSPGARGRPSPKGSFWELSG